MKRKKKTDTQNSKKKTVRWQGAVKSGTLAAAAEAPHFGGGDAARSAAHGGGEATLLPGRSILFNLIFLYFI